MKNNCHIAVENIVRKGEIACNKQFLLFLQCFPQLYIFDASKYGIVGLTLKVKQPVIDYIILFGKSDINVDFKFRKPWRIRPRMPFTIVCKYRL